MSLLTVGAFAGCTDDVAATSAGQLLTTRAEPALAAQMVADSQYMTSIFGIDNSAPDKRKRIDLADPQQYRFVTNRLLASGKTAETAPELFHRLDRARAKTLATPKAEREDTGVDRDARCAAFILLGKETKLDKERIQFVNTHPVVSCMGGASYVYTDITTYDTDAKGTEARSIKSAAGEDFSGGINFEGVTISPILTARIDHMNRTESLTVAIDDRDQEQITYNTIVSNLVPIPGSVDLSHPAIHDWIDNGGHIQMCQLRGSPNQCDYAVGSLFKGDFTGWVPNASGVYTGIDAVLPKTGSNGTPWEGDPAHYFAFSTPYDANHVYLPVQGVLDVGATATADCKILSIDFATLRLVKAVTGGICTTTTDFSSAIVIPRNSRTATFRTIADFTNDGGTSADVASCALDRIVNEDVKPSITIKAMADCGTGTAVPRFASLTPTGGNALPHRIFFLNSCFAEGTPIRRADGSRATVETLRAGDRVISDAKGTVLTVMATSSGGENEPLVELRDDKRHRLQLTAKHPLVRASGEVVMASAIQIGDRVMTDRGIARIVSTTRVPYDGKVYNLKLGTDAERARVGKRGTTMFAGGFLAGDSSMQQDL
ncbi:MAG: hypothetical protein H7138_24530, partial [Myxococcales bacterium]|nr:hypothetical protein [Myxococcales bacterium]